MRKIGLIVGLLTLTLAACGQADSSAPPAVGAPPTIAQPPTAALATLAPSQIPAQPTASATPAPTDAPQPTTPPATPGQATGSGVSVAPPRELVSAAQQQLAKYLKVSADDLLMQSAKEQEWPDGSLGCPQEGMAYPQVVTPGFMLIFTNRSQSVQYAVHTGRSAAQMVFCDNKQPVDLSVKPSASSTAQPANSAAPIDSATKRVAEMARQALAAELGIQAADVTVAAVEEVQWNDSSLGCPRPGVNYLQVITPGYKLTLEAQGKRYEYHSDLNRRVVRCDQP